MAICYLIVRSLIDVLVSISVKIDPMVGQLKTLKCPKEYKETNMSITIRFQCHNRSSKRKKKIAYEPSTMKNFKA
jgi:hypothetical protein